MYGHQIPFQMSQNVFAANNSEHIQPLCQPSYRQNYNFCRGQTQEKKAPEQPIKQMSQPQSNLTETKPNSLIRIHEKSQVTQPNNFGKKKNSNQLQKVVTRLEKNNNNDDIAPNGINNKIYNNQNISQKIQSNRYYIDDLITAFQDETVSFSKLFRDNFVHAFNFIPTLKSVQFVQAEDKEKLERKIKLDPYPQNLKFKKTVIFDLDETLVHCNEDESMPSQILLPITFPTGEKVNAGINIRPFAEKMIQLLSNVCEVMIFTASHECYANEVINHLDPQSRVKRRIFRDSCVTDENSIYYIKNLEVIDRDLKDVVIVDNASYSFFHHLENGIPIISFYDDKQDNQLIKLYRFLINKILPLDDVRPLLKEYFKLDQIDQFQTIVEAVEKMYCIE
ncbi:unnamed protein product [Paramecium octaurelia]|uniref:FCP1 homology domain-containing protein n=1 Tax=Paramecium octaurelia TaxID=43137 RepID=A0A8S1SZQ0_PAROT|nr:unnamed protein product [Paramecium octaurelia]